MVSGFYDKNLLFDLYQSYDLRTNSTYKTRYISFAACADEVYTPRGVETSVFHLLPHKYLSCNTYSAR